jgi:hypothetical protein
MEHSGAQGMTYWQFMCERIGAAGSENKAQKGTLLT